MSELAGKHVVITGATGALGAAVVPALLGRGATCHLPMVEPSVPAHVGWKDTAGVVATPGVALDDEAAVSKYYAALPGLWASIHLVGGFAMETGGWFKTSPTPAGSAWPAFPIPS